MTRRTRLARVLVKEIGVLFVSQGNRTVDSPIKVRNYQLKPEIPVGGCLKFFPKNWEKNYRRSVDNFNNERRLQIRVSEKNLLAQV
jgi:hypothetical protein